MRIYEGSPRQDYEEVFRSIGAFIDQRGMREILLVEAPDGFIIQGIVGSLTDTAAWSDPLAAAEKETYTFLDDDIARFMEEAIARRRVHGAAQPDPHQAGPYERSLRVLGRYIDQQNPRDVFFLEQDGSYVVRLLMATRQGLKHVLAEFTADELGMMVEHGSTTRGVAV
jgi:hypothetical protein